MTYGPSTGLAPFCASPAARAAFDAWRARLDGLGLELSDGDLYLVGRVAACEVRLVDLQARVEAEEDQDRRLRLVESERRAGTAFQAALEVLERAVAGRVADAEELVTAAPRSVAGGGKVLTMPARSTKTRAGGLARRLKGPEAVRERIPAALNKAGCPLTKAELRKLVRGDATTFLRVLESLVAAGEVVRVGAGVRGHPRRYTAKGAA